jgi:hypothetical protein
MGLLWQGIQNLSTHLRSTGAASNLFLKSDGSEISENAARFAKKRDGLIKPLIFSLAFFFEEISVMFVRAKTRDDGMSSVGDGKGLSKMREKEIWIERGKV